MKASSIFCISAIAASSLITLSSAAMAISEPKSNSVNQSQSALISERSTQMQKAGSGAQTNGRICIPILDPLCGWW
jgi:hypothetical protein